MSATGAGGPRVQRLFQRASEQKSLAGVIFTGIGAVLFAFYEAAASFVLALADVVIVPLQELTIAAGEWINALIGGAAGIVNIGAITSGASIAPGSMFDVGPATFALAVASVLLALFIVDWYLGQPVTGNISAVIPFDIPTPGIQDAEEDNEEA